MVELTRLGGAAFALNPDLIERVEATPDTLITLVTGNRYLVEQSIGEIAELVDLHRAGVIAAAGAMLGSAPLAPVAQETHQDRHPAAAHAAVVPLRPQEA